MMADSSVAANAVLIIFAVSFCGAGLAWFKRWGHTLAETMAYVLLSMIMIQSWMAQVLLLTGLTVLYLPALVLCTCLALRVCFTHRRFVFSQFGTFIRFVRSHRLAISGLLLVWGYVAVACVWPLVKFSGPDLDYYQPIWHNPRTILSIWTAHPDMVLPVLNHAVFAASWQPPLAIALANVSAYTAIGFSTYALARRYAWPPMAITVTLLVISMHRIVQQSLVAPSELLPAAAALVAVLAIYRMCEQPHWLDLIMLIGAVSFSVSGGRLCFLMPAVLGALSLVAMGRRHGMRMAGAQVPGKWGGILMAGALIMVFTQSSVIWANLMAGKAWIGEPLYDSVVFNPDALMGTAGNLARYLFLAFDMPDFVDHFFRWSLGFSLLSALKGLYQSVVATTLAGRGAAVAFDWSWASGPDFSWFGPAGFCLVMPSLGVALARGPRRLKFTALAMTAYWVLVGLILAWRPENVRRMTVFFVCSGFMMAFLLPHWRFGRRGWLVLQALSILLLAHELLP